MCLIGLGLRLWVVFCLPLEPVFDFKRYYEVATSFATSGQMLVAGHSYVIQGPAYPFLLGAFFYVFGGGVLQGKLLNVLLWLAAMPLMAGAGSMLGLSRWMSLLMVGVMSLHPGLVLYVSVLGTETLCIFLVSACLWAALKGSRVSLCTLGVSLAALSLTRPQFMPLALLFVLFLGGGWRSIGVRALYCLLPFVLVMTPWAIRNYWVFDQFIPVSASAGYVSMVNNNDRADGHWMPLSDVPLTDEDRLRFRLDGSTSFFAPGNEGQKVIRWPPYNDKVAADMARNWIKAHPREFARLACRRLLIAFYADGGDMLFWPLRDAGRSNALFQMVRAFDLALFAVAVAGMWLMVWRRRGYWRAGLVAALIVLGGVSAIAVFEGQGRYVLPLVPAALVLALLPVARNLHRTSPGEHYGTAV